MSDINLVLSYGITFGILLMTIFYTLVRYIYLKELTYLAYSFMQVFSLLFIASYSKLFEINPIFQEIGLIAASLSAIVFALGFYEGDFFPKINDFKHLLLNTLLLNIVILTAFYHYLLFEYLPYTIIYIILFTSVIFNPKKGSRPILIYVIGWSIFCFVLFVLDFKSFYIQKEYIDIVLLAFAIEAVLFTMSVAYKYNTLQNQSDSYEDVILQQSKLVKSGEMIANITHQFRQPLNNLSYILMNIKKRFENKKLDELYFEKKVSQANEQLQFLSKTIEDFKSFYTPTKKKENFSIKEAINSSYTILSADLEKKNIKFEIEFKTNEDICIYGIKNELSQVILSIIANAADALKNKEEPQIKVTVSSDDALVLVSIEDNAGGIKKKNLDKIFEPYFSTKDSGMGIGLYLVKLIIEKSFEGNISVSNTKKGACFKLSFEK